MEKKHGHQYKDITGQRFGNIIILCDSGLRQNRKIVWTCQCDCGEIFNTRSDHIHSGKTKSCPKCAQEKNIDNLLLKNNVTRKDFKPGDKFGKLVLIEKLNKKNINRCFYWKCQCECGRIVEVDNGHIGKTLSCGYCLRSKGELKIQTILEENNIFFEKEKTFSTCRFPETNGIARFDFYLPQYNLLIEFDGKQHFEYNNNFWNTEQQVKITQEKDKYKENWAKNNNIKLKRIPYYDYNKITLDYLLK